MSYASIEFLLFVLVLVLIYYIFPKKHRYIVLLIGSLIFYYLFSGTFAITLYITLLLV